MEGKKKYNIEKEGQQDFFDNFHIDYQGDASVLVDNTDGVYHGNILEFKLNISNTGKVLLQLTPLTVKTVGFLSKSTALAVVYT